MKLIFLAVLTLLPFTASAAKFRCQSEDGATAAISVESAEAYFSTQIAGVPYGCRREGWPPARDAGFRLSAAQLDAAARYQCPAGWSPGGGDIYCARRGAVIMLDPWDSGRPVVIKDGFANGPGGHHRCAVIGVLVTC